MQATTHDTAGSRRGADGAAATDRRRQVAILLSGFIALKLAFLVLLAWNSKFIMDEYWLVGRVWLLSAEPYQSVWPAKTLLYAVFFKLAHWLGGDAVEVMQAARLQTVGLSILGLSVLYGIARNMGRDRLEALFALCVVLAVSSYMERAFMTRPEPLALFFALCALWVVTRGPGDLRAVLVAGLLSGLAFCTLQKAVYFNLALGLALVGDGLLRRSLGRAVRTGAVLVLGWAIVLLLYSAFFTLEGAAFTDVVRQVFTGSTGNALRGHTVYEGLRTYVAQTFLRNPAQYLLCIAGWLMAAPHILRAAGAARLVWLFTGVIATLVYLHPAPWPYNFIMAIPFLGLWAPVVTTALAKGSSGKAALIIGAVTLALSVSFARNAAYLGHNNTVQNETVRRAESLLGPEDTYADGIGMVVTRRRAGREQWWARYTLLRILDDVQRGDHALIEAVFADSPKVWILNYRTDTVADVLQGYLDQSYVAIFPNVLIAGRELAPGQEVVFQVPYPGRYRLYGADGRPAEAPLTVDGRPARGEVALGKGRHVVRLDGEITGLSLLPAEIAVPFDLSRSRAQRTLFGEIYTF